MKKPLLVITVFLLLLFLLPFCKKQRTLDPRCNKNPEPGPCLAAIVRYYYDKEEKMCKPFIWGGCGDVPFETLEECKSCKCDR